MEGCVTDWIPESRQPEDEVDCCDSLLVSTSNPRSRAFDAQDEKFGIYRLQYVDRSPEGQGRATFKHIERDLFLYYIKENNNVHGWIIGPKPGISIGGLFARVIYLLYYLYFFKRKYFWINSSTLMKLISYYVVGKVYLQCLISKCQN